MERDGRRTLDEPGHGRRHEGHRRAVQARAKRGRGRQAGLDREQLRRVAGGRCSVAKHHEQQARRPRPARDHQDLPALQRAVDAGRDRDAPCLGPGREGRPKPVPRPCAVLPPAKGTHIFRRCWRRTLACDRERATGFPAYAGRARTVPGSHPTSRSRQRRRRDVGNPPHVGAGQGLFRSQRRESEHLLEKGLLVPRRHERQPVQDQLAGRSGPIHVGRVQHGQDVGVRHGADSVGSEEGLAGSQESRRETGCRPVELLQARPVSSGIAGGG